MAGGRALVRDKLVAGTGFRLLALIPTLLFALVAVAGAVSAPFTDAPASLHVGAVAFGTVMAAFLGIGFLTTTVLRTVVTDRELHVQCGLMGPRIPLEKIESCKVGEQRNRIRVGKRFEDGLWTSSYLLRTGGYVEVVYEDGGKRRRVLFSPQDPQGVADAIERARAARAGGARFEDTAAETDAAAATEAEAHAEAEAEADRAQRRR
jgi:hypothetical protein